MRYNTAPAQSLQPFVAGASRGASRMLAIFSDVMQAQQRQDAVQEAIEAAGGDYQKAADLLFQGGYMDVGAGFLQAARQQQEARHASRVMDLNEARQTLAERQFAASLMPQPPDQSEMDRRLIAQIEENCAGDVNCVVESLRANGRHDLAGSARQFAPEEEPEQADVDPHQDFLRMAREEAERQGEPWDPAAVEAEWQRRTARPEAPEEPGIEELRQQATAEAMRRHGGNREAAAADLRMSGLTIAASRLLDSGGRQQDQRTRGQKNAQERVEKLLSSDACIFDPPACADTYQQHRDGLSPEDRYDYDARFMPPTPEPAPAAVEPEPGLLSRLGASLGGLFDRPMDRHSTGVTGASLIDAGTAVGAGQLDPRMLGAPPPRRQGYSQADLARMIATGQ